MQAADIKTRFRRLFVRVAKPLGLIVTPKADVEARAAERERLLQILAHERRKVVRLKQRLADTTSRHESDNASLNRHIEELRQTRTDGEDQRRRLAERTAELEAELQRSADEISRQRLEITTMAEAYARLAQERDAYQEENARLSKALTRPSDLPAIMQRQGDEAWVTSLGRARVRAKGRAAYLDARDHSGNYPEDGQISTRWPALVPSLAEGPSRSWAPLRIAVVGESKSPFLGFNDPRILARQLGDPLVENADVLVFPRSDATELFAHSDLVPKRLWRRAQQGRLTVAFDASNEGQIHEAERSERFHGFLAERSISPSTAAYLTQDRGYRSEYQSWCARRGEDPMRIIVFDAYVHRTLKANLDDGEIAFEQRLASFQERPQHRSRRFVSLNYSPRPSKILFLLRLMRDGLWDKGWISFGGFAPRREKASLSRPWAVERLRELVGFADDVESALPFIEQLDALGPSLLGTRGNTVARLDRKKMLSATRLAQYGDSWFSVVTETAMTTARHRITEKPLAALLNFHPFLMIGGLGSLDLVRGYGFETYSSIFDERYDAEPDLRRRFDMVYDQVVKLCSMDEADLARLSSRAAEIMTFNACWGLTKLPRILNDKIGSELIDQLIPEGHMMAVPSRRNGVT